MLTLAKTDTTNTIKDKSNRIILTVNTIVFNLQA